MKIIDNPLETLEKRSKDLNSSQYAYKLQDNRYGLGVSSETPLAVDENDMSIRIPFADGNRRDGVGDLLEVGGIRTERHQKNPLCLYDHAKTVSLPIGMAWVWDKVAGKYDTSRYTVEIDTITKTAAGTCFVYQGKGGVEGVSGDEEYAHAILCEQYFHMAASGMLRGGSIGYQVIKALELPPDYATGTPQGLHLLVTLMLEFSLVVLPANMDTVMKALSAPTMCGKPLSPVLIKSLSEFVPEQTKTQVAVPIANLPTAPIPPAKWKPGVGTVGNSIKEIRQKYRSKSVDLDSQRDKISKQYESLVVDDMHESQEAIAKLARQYNASEEDVRKVLRATGKLRQGKAAPGATEATPFTSGQPRGATRIPGTAYVFAAGDRVTARTHIFRRGTTEVFARPGDKLRIVSIADPNSNCIAKNDRGDEQQVSFSNLRKNMEAEETKSLNLKGIRQKYRNPKSMRRRLRKSSPGSSLVYVDRKNVDKAKELAEQKGLKFQRMGGEDGIEKIKLIGADEAIDDVAKHYGTPISRKRIKSMNVETKGWGDWLKAVLNAIAALTGNPVTYGDLDDGDEEELEQMYRSGASPKDAARRKKSLKKILPTKGTKAMGESPDDNMTGTEAGSELDNAAAEEPTEPYGAQVARRIHEDHSLLMQDYDKHMNLLEDFHPVKPHLKSIMQGHEKTLSDTEKLFKKHYKDLPPIAGALDEDAMGDDGADDDELVDTNGDGKDLDEAVEATSGEGEEEETPPLDAYEGSQGEGKAKEDDKEDKDKDKKSLRRKWRKKAMCPKCKETDCKCGKSISAKKKDLTEDEAGKIGAEVEAVADDLAEETEDTEPTADQKKSISAASAHCKALSKANDFTDEHRMESYAHGKALEGLTNTEAVADDELESPDPLGTGGMSNETSGKAVKDMEDEADAMQPEMKSWHKSCSAAGKFLKSMAYEKAFGDPHRAEAAHHAKELDGISSSPPDAIEDEATTEETESADATYKPGEMGEKKVPAETKALKQVFLQQKQQMSELNRVLEALTKT